MVKNPPTIAGDTGNTKDMGLIPGSGRCPEVGNGNLLKYSCLENSKGTGDWLATAHGVAKVGCDWASTHTCTHAQAWIVYIFTLM